MSDVVIQVENLGKRFRLGELDPYRNIGEIVTRAVAKRLRPRAGRPPAQSEDLWALSEITFEVRRGEILGIVGRNGAGKSTLLKILSRVTRPTTGAVRLRGRVGSLLEVGTGFHPELTGRENVYLNGVVLGMRRHEIERRFDEIVEFAGVEQFLNTPVKRYSSGMQVRLAFAVAAHLETDILIVDEVLAVGDAEFQSKCLGKIGEIVEKGRTILFVSHNMSAVRRLCRRAVLLEAGRLVADGSAADIVADYLSRTPGGIPAGWVSVSHLARRGNGRAHVSDVSFTSGVERFGFNPFPGGPFEVTLAVESDADRTLGSAALLVFDGYGTRLVNADSMSIGRSVRLRRGRNLVCFRVERLHLNPGLYLLGWWLSDPLGNTVFDFVENGINVEVVNDDPNVLGARPAVDGVVACEFTVETSSVA